MRKVIGIREWVFTIPSVERPSLAMYPCLEEKKKKEKKKEKTIER